MDDKIWKNVILIPHVSLMKLPFFNDNYRTWINQLFGKSRKIQEEIKSREIPASEVNGHVWDEAIMLSN